MKKITLFLILLIIGISFSSAQDLTNPHKILTKYCQTKGGVKNLIADSLYYAEAEIEIGNSVKGDLTIWQKGDKEKRIVNLPVMSFTTGDNSKISWRLNSDGELNTEEIEKSPNQELYNKLKGNYAYLDPNIKYFSAELQGIEEVENKKCYKIKLTNTLNDDIDTYFINTENFYLEKLKKESENLNFEVKYYDYRNVNGILMSYKTVTDVMGNPQTITYSVQKNDVQISDSIFDPPAEKTLFTFKNGKNSENIPFESSEGLIFLNGLIEGKFTKWILDSGAGSNVIDVNKAKELGLDSGSEFFGAGVGKKVKMSRTTVPELYIEGVKFEEQEYISSDINSIIEKASGIEIAGLLGHSFIEKFVMKVDYANSTISLYDTKDFEYKGDGKEIDLKFYHNSIPYISDFSVDGNYKGDWILDLGATGCVFFHPYAEKNNFFEKKGIEKVVFGAGGVHEYFVTKFDEVQFAGFEVDEPYFTMPKEKGEGIASSEEFLGVIGASVLRHFVIYFDYTNSRLIIEKGEEFTKEFSRDKSGLFFMMNNEKEVEVISVPEGTPADKSGFEVGDILVSINGIDVKNFGNLQKIKNIFKDEEGKEFIIGIIREGDEKEIPLELKSYL